MTPELEDAVRHALVADAPTTSPAFDWSALSARSRRRVALRRVAAVAVGGALVGGLVVTAPWSGDGSTASVPAAPPVPTEPTPWDPIALDQDGCPSGTTIVRTTDDLGSTGLVQTPNGIWVCTTATSSPDGSTSFFSSPWDEVSADPDDGTWLGPLPLETCDGEPCGTVLWSAVGAVPAGVTQVTVQVVGEPQIHRATVSGSSWAIRLVRPANENSIDLTSDRATGDALAIQAAFVEVAVPADDAYFMAVTPEFRAACAASHAAIDFPPWNELACTDELLQHNIGTRAVDFAFSLRYDARCEWYAEYLVSAEQQDSDRASEALKVIGEIPSWPGYRGNEFGSFAAQVYQRLLVGDLDLVRGRFPPSSDEVADCSYDYLAQARAWGR